MLKCKYNEDCSHYPTCGKICGLSLEELVWRKNQQMRDLRFQMDQGLTKLMQISGIVHQTEQSLVKRDYIPTCPFGCVDCVNDPAYIQRYHSQWWEELGMPVECDAISSLEDKSFCPYYDDEDK